MRYNKIMIPKKAGARKSAPENTQAKTNTQVPKAVGSLGALPSPLGTSLIDKIVAVEKAGRAGQYTVVERFHLDAAGHRAAPYYVLQSVREGTTHGKQRSSRAECQAEYDAGVQRQSDSFRAELDKMSEVQLGLQAAYWLAENTQETNTQVPKAQAPKLETKVGSLGTSPPLGIFPSLSENAPKDGYELRFPEKPAEEILTALKQHGWRWSRFSHCWYAKRSPISKAFAETIVGQHSTFNIQPPATPKSEIPNLEVESSKLNVECSAPPPNNIIPLNFVAQTVAFHSQLSTPADDWQSQLRP